MRRDILVPDLSASHPAPQPTHACGASCGTCKRRGSILEGTYVCTAVDDIKYDPHLALILVQSPVLSALLSAGGKREEKIFDLVDAYLGLLRIKGPAWLPQYPVGWGQVVGGRERDRRMSAAERQMLAGIDVQHAGVCLLTLWLAQVCWSTIRARAAKKSSLLSTFRVEEVLKDEVGWSNNRGFQRTHVLYVFAFYCVLDFGHMAMAASCVSTRTFCFVGYMCAQRCKLKRQSKANTYSSLSAASWCSG